MFAQSLKSIDADSIDEEYCRWIHIVERELGAHIDDQYPLMKFLNQVEMCVWYKEEEERAHKQRTLK